MEKPKFKPELWVVTKEGAGSVMGKIEGAYMADGWVYIVNSGQDNKYHIQEDEIKLVLVGKEWIEPSDGQNNIRW